MTKEPSNKKPLKRSEASAYWVYLEAFSANLHNLNEVSIYAQSIAKILREATKGIAPAHSIDDLTQALEDEVRHIRNLVCSMEEMVRSGGPRIHCERQELIESLESFDFVTLPAATRYYESKDLGDIAGRISFLHTPGYAAPKMLKHTFLDVYEGKVAPFLDFYERAFYGGDPHYEDAIVIATLILTGIGAIATPFLAALYSEDLRKRAERAREKVGLLDQRDIRELLDYLLKAYALREAWENDEINFEFFTWGRRRMRLRLSRIRTNEKKGLLIGRDDLPKADSNRLENITSKWFDKHHLDMSDALMSELVKELEAELRRRQSVPVKMPDETKNWRVIRGVGASPGKAFGPASNVLLERPNSISSGIVGIFDSWEPEMVEIVEKCVASVGTRGGRTSHLAIVSRVLGIPSVVGVGEISIRDGVRVFVDGDDGTVLVEPSKRGMKGDSKHSDCSPPDKSA